MGLRHRLQRQLKEKLINENIKLREIARATGVSPATLSRIARGKTPTLEVYQKLNNYLNPDSHEANSGGVYFLSFAAGDVFGNGVFRSDKPFGSLESIRAWERDYENKTGQDKGSVIIISWKEL